MYHHAPPYLLDLRGGAPLQTRGTTDLHLLYIFRMYRMYRLVVINLHCGCLATFVGDSLEVFKMLTVD